jgi:hypothetical protein
MNAYSVGPPLKLETDGQSLDSNQDQAHLEQKID